MKKIEDYDERQYCLDMRMYERSLANSALRFRAEENALVSHRVTSYVKTLPVDDPRIPLYPAISYHQFVELIDGTDTVSDAVQDIPLDAY